MTTLHPIACVFVGIVKRIRDEFFDHGLERLSETGHHFDWLTVGGQCRREEDADGLGSTRRGAEYVEAWRH